MTPSELLAFVRTHRLAVQTSVARDETPQAAVVGIAVSETFEIVFDTLETTRKIRNIRREPSVAFVIGGSSDGDERTVQYEGVADEPAGDDLERIKAVYFAAWPDGRAREAWPGLVYVRVRPTWIRYSDFNQNPPRIVEFTRDQLTTAGH